MNKEKYTEEIKCPNCGRREVHSIPKGVRVDQYRERTQCSKCGCYLVWI